jgi:integrase
MAYFYRRPNGIYYARIRVPDALRPAFGASDLRRTLHTSDHALASRLALAAAFEWKSKFEQMLSMLDIKKLVTGSPLLLTTGLISLEDAAPAIGLSVHSLFSEAKAKRIAVRIMANGWFGADVPSSELVLDNPAACTAVYDIGETLHGREMAPIFGELYVRSEELPLAEPDGMLNACIFYRDPARRRAVVVDFPGVSVATSNLLVERTDIEALRARLAARVTPAMLSAAPSSVPTISHVDQITEAVERGQMGPAYKHKNTHTSSMLAAYYAEKGPGWAPATLDKNKRMCGVFVDLMGDPTLSKINQEFVKSYRLKLQGVPTNLHRVKAKYPELDLDGLIRIAQTEKLEVISVSLADRYVAQIGEAFVWAKDNNYMTVNPAANVAKSAKREKRSQDNRQAFDTAMLARIFDQAWFLEGKGMPTKSGKYHNFQPFNYWMPLIALFTGARLNEIAQLHLKDVAMTELGQWYLDFNLEGDGKIDADSKGEGKTAGSDGKRLKTINAERIVTLHPELVRLGLPGYVQALRDNGQLRLFPELTWDKIKGHGKYAGQWFNERFMGEKLRVARDGTLTFHSFRHTFLTACDRLGMSDRVRDELAGHSRGRGEGHTTYIKDRSADELAPHLAPLRFDLPTIAPFNVAAGLIALQDALDRKKRG